MLITQQQTSFTCEITFVHIFFEMWVEKLHHRDSVMSLIQFGCDCATLGGICGKTSPCAVQPCCCTTICLKKMCLPSISCQSMKCFHCSSSPLFITFSPNWHPSNALLFGPVPFKKSLGGLFVITNEKACYFKVLRVFSS